MDSPTQYEVNWTKRALKQLESITNYIAEREQDPQQAIRVLQEVKKQAARLKSLPHAKGRIVPEIGKTDFRELFVYSYRLIYRVDPKTVTVVRIFHGARHWEGGL